VLAGEDDAHRLVVDIRAQHWRAFDVQKIVALEAAADPDLIARRFDLTDDVAVRSGCGRY